MTGCYRCGDDDHYSRDCPANSREWPRSSPPSPASGQTALPPRLDDKPVPVYAPADPELAHAWANDIRQALDWGEPVSEDRTQFAQRHRIPSRTEGQLRTLAAQQAAESRSARLTG